MLRKPTSKTLLTAVAGGAAAVAAALVATRRKQERARAEGRHVPYGPYEAVVKRPLDAAIAAGSLIALSPVMAATALLVRIKLGSPVIFEQERPGLDAKPFAIYKFRTMTNARDENGNLLSDEDRLTNFGKALRSTSFDELPELFNILKGDMSLVGPRPLINGYLPLYNDEQRHRHDVRPGVTGLAQTRGRNSLSWEQKFAYDIEYVNGCTLKTDLLIILKTFQVVLSREGISSSTSSTMEAFTGNSSSEID